MKMRVGNLRVIMYKESWMPKNWCFWTVVLEKTLDSPLDYKEIQPVHPTGNQSWMFIGRTDVETPILWPPDVKNSHWKRPWCWERLKARGEGDNRGWDCWMTSPAWQTRVWVSSGSWWWTGKPGMLQSMGLQRVGHYWATELNWTELNIASVPSLGFRNELNLQGLKNPSMVPCGPEKKIHSLHSGVSSLIDKVLAIFSPPKPGLSRQLQQLIILIFNFIYLCGLSPLLDYNLLEVKDFIFLTGVSSTQHKSQDRMSALRLYLGEGVPWRIFPFVSGWKGTE